MIGIVSTVGNDSAALTHMTLKAVTGLGDTCLLQAGQPGCLPSGADGQGGPDHHTPDAAWNSSRLWSCRWPAPGCCFFYTIGGNPVGFDVTCVNHQRAEVCALTC